MTLGDRIGEGRTAEIFEWGDGLVVKLFRSFMSEDAADHEAFVTSVAAAAGAPTPACHGIVDVEGRRGVVYERLGGPMLGQAIFDGDPFGAMRDLGLVHAAIHQALAPELEVFSDRVRKASAALPDRVAAAVNERLRELGDGDTLLHADLHPWNVMAGRAGWVAIDWDAARRGDPMADVARTVFLLAESPLSEEVAATDIAQRRHELAEAYLAAYAGEAPLDRGRVSAWRLPILAARTREHIPEEVGVIEEMIEDELA